MTQLNKPNLTRLRNHLAALPEDAREFDMSDWCGTTCCIAGHAFILAEGRPATSADKVPGVAKEWLGLNSREHSWLFIGHFQNNDHLDGVRPSHAVLAIDHLLADKSVIEYDTTEWVKICETERPERDPDFC